MRSIRNCSVAVVGGAGFLGSHAVNYLIEDRGCDVLVIDNLVVGRREFIHPKAKFEHHDITTSEEHIRNLFVKYKVEYVGNWAAYPYIPISFARPKLVSEVNFMGAINIINAAQEAGCKGILQVSSAEIYGGTDIVGLHNDSLRDGINEHFPIQPHSTYGAAKAAVDYYCQCAWRERRTPVIALRQFNCVGERETHPYVIPEIIGQLAAQQTWEDYGMIGMGMLDPPSGCKFYDGRVMRLRTPQSAAVKLGNNSLRDFMYAGDAVRIAVELLERGQFGEVYNLGSESGVKIYDLAKAIGTLMGFADVKVEEDATRKRPWEIWHLQSDNTKINAVLGDSKTLPLSLGFALRKTIKWYEANGRKWPWE